MRGRSGEFLSCGSKDIMHFSPGFRHESTTVTGGKWSAYLYSTL